MCSLRSATHDSRKAMALSQWVLTVNSSPDSLHVFACLRRRQHGLEILQESSTLPSACNHANHKKLPKYGYADSLQRGMLVSTSISCVRNKCSSCACLHSSVTSSHRHQVINGEMNQAIFGLSALTVERVFAQ